MGLDSISSLSPALLYAEIYINSSNEKITVDKLKGRAFQCEWKVPGSTPGLHSSLLEEFIYLKLK